MWYRTDLVRDYLLNWNDVRRTVVARHPGSLVKSLAAHGSADRTGTWQETGAGET